MKNMECSKGFSCYHRQLGGLCSATKIGNSNYIKCDELLPVSCDFIAPVKGIKICQCRIRKYILDEISSDKVMYEIEYDSKDQIIIIRGAPNPTKESIKKAIEETIELSEIENCYNVIVDGTDTKKIPKEFSLYIISEFIHGRIKEYLKFRVVYVIAGDSLNDFKFFETLTFNRGIPVNTFTTFADAKDWILNKD